MVQKTLFFGRGPSARRFLDRAPELEDSLSETVTSDFVVDVPSVFWDVELLLESSADFLLLPELISESSETDLVLLDAEISRD